MDYNDTLEHLRNHNYPRFVQKVNFGPLYRLNDDATKRIAPKKGQRQKHDIFAWLLNKQQDWPIIRITTSSIALQKQQKQHQQRQSKRLFTKSIDDANKKFRIGE
jgi:hypothetical protein